MPYLKVETGRYGKLRQDIANRACPHCCSQDDIYLLSKLPFFQHIIEDEHHLLHICPLYNDARKKIKTVSRDLINKGSMKELFSHPLHIKELARYLSRCHKLRFPKEENV